MVRTFKKYILSGDEGSSFQRTVANVATITCLCCFMHSLNNNNAYTLDMSSNS